MLPKCITALRALSLLSLFIPLLVLADQSQAKAVKLLIVGDSLSAAYQMKQEQGWIHLLQNAWTDQPITVINAAISGDTTDGGLARLPRLLEQHQPTHMLLELGGNDALQGHSIKKMRGNLRQMIELAQQQGVQVLLQQMMIPTNYGKRYQTMFTSSYQILAEQYQLPLVPFFLEDIALDPELMFADGIHPNVKAQPLIAEKMQKMLTPLLQN